MSLQLHDPATCLLRGGVRPALHAVCTHVTCAIACSLTAGWILDKVGSSLRNAMMLQMGASLHGSNCLHSGLHGGPGASSLCHPCLQIGLLGVFLLCRPLSVSLSPAQSHHGRITFTR